jgi:polyketide biosynthesis acyl carrier protein
MTVSHSADECPARSEARRILYEVITDILPGVQLDEIDPSQHLKDLGADSVDRVEIITIAVERLGVRKPASAFSATRDISTLLDRLTAAL